MKELLCDAVSVMETWWAKFPQDMSASDRAVLTRMQAEIDAPEPYDQQALELCDACGWKTLIPDDCCLNCTRPNPDQEPHGWLIQGSNHLYRGEYAEIDSKSDAQRIGGTCHAYSLYTKPQPAAKQVARLIGDCTVEQLPPDGHAMVWARLLICDNVLGAWGDPRWTRFSWWKAMLKGDSPSASGGWMLDPSCNDKWVQQLDITHWAPMPPDVNQGSSVAEPRASVQLIWRMILMMQANCCSTAAPRSPPSTTEPRIQSSKPCVKTIAACSSAPSENLR